MKIKEEIPSRWLEELYEVIAFEYFIQFLLKQQARIKPVVKAQNINMNRPARRVMRSVNRNR